MPALSFLSLLSLLLLAAVACGDDGAVADAGTDSSTSVLDSATDTALPPTCSAGADCDDGLFCNGAEACSVGMCERGPVPCVAGESCNEAAGSCDPIAPGGTDLPVGIPTPSFGWRYDTSGPGTLFVDNTNAACDDGGPGSAAVPYCDLFQGGSAVSYESGAVVHVLGGPYAVAGDYALTMNGSADAPVVILGPGADRVLFDGGGTRANFEWAGSYGIVENVDFFHQTRHRVVGDHLTLENVAVHNPVDAFIDFNPVVSVTGHDVLIHGSEIFNNRRTSDTDSHGIQASQGSFNVWVLDNELYNNNGDSFQACHRCFAAPPHHVYLGRNVMHDDRENGIDLKTIHDVVISENVLYGYGSSSTSNGDAMVIGSNGFDDAMNQGPRRIWVLNNEFRDSSTGIRIEGSEDVWLIGNVMSNVAVGLQIDDKPHREIVVAANTITDVGAGDGVNIWGCRPSGLTFVNNVIHGTAERQIDVQPCGAPALSIVNNVLWTSGTGLSVRADGTQHASAASLAAESFAMANIDADPGLEVGTLVPAAGSPAIDTGTSLDAYYLAFTAAFGGDIAFDRAGTPRPTGAGMDIGAYERP